MPARLRDDEQLRAACAASRAKRAQEPAHGNWISKLGDLLHRVRDADRSEFTASGFQRDLWESDAVSATGMGQVDVSGILASSDVADFLWQTKSRPLPSDGAARAAAISAEWEAFNLLVKPLVDRTPRLKMYRVFAALRPEDFTTVTHQFKIRQLARAMGVHRNAGNPVELHRRVLDRLAEVLGSPGEPLSPDWLERMTLPWSLFVDHVQELDPEATEIASPVAGIATLRPLPAERRRRGMLSIAGGLSSVRSMIEFASDGCTREDFREHIRSVSPQLATSSINTTLNALIAEWGVLLADGDRLALTPRGEALLETGEQEEVSDWLLTRILGFDNLLRFLVPGPRSNKEAIEHLQQVNPGWTSNFLPTSMISWMKHLELAEVGPARELRLTPRGREWESRIHWDPGMLPAGATGAAPAAAGQIKVSVDGGDQGPVFQRPALDRIIGTLPPQFNFQPELVARLDAGLWSHPLRHFAVLTGLSGAGKTQLARHYAHALRAGEPDPGKGCHIVPVQPGWHDPASLLGYVNPLDTDSYIQSGFIHFLLEAANDPERPYTVILDEMNLSHPEQYLAPLLSAMETGGDIELHAQGDVVDGIPSRIPYPANLVLIGTVNMDETTHGLSDKVLDRASVIEFWDIDVEAFPGWGASGLPAAQAEQLRTLLVALTEILRPVRLHFGWRTIGDVIGFVRSAAAGGILDSVQSIDHAIYSKILPKLRGEHTARLENALNSVAQVLEQAGMTQSAGKCRELADDLVTLGSARFWR